MPKIQLTTSLFSMSDKVVDPRFAKSGEYKEVINTIAAKGKCPFCPDNFRYHKEPILKEEGDWLITKNSWPYKNSQHHFIVICKTHKELLPEVTVDDWVAISSLMNWAIKEFNLKGGGIAMRFGETT